MAFHALEMRKILQIDLVILTKFVNYVCTIIEPRHKKTCLCHMRTTKAQISLRIRLCCSLPG